LSAQQLHTLQHTFVAGLHAAFVESAAIGAVGVLTAATGGKEGA
jgi:hypothetical protein